MRGSNDGSGLIGSESRVTRAAQFLRRGAGVWQFCRHFLEMCIAMCLGMMILSPVFLGIARIVGYSDPLRQLPELSALVMAFNMTAPMAAWMRYRGMEWGSIVEMSGVMFLEAALLVGAYWLGAFPQSRLVPLQHTLMMPAMLLPMLYRRHVYMGHSGHRAHLAQASLEVD